MPAKKVLVLVHQTDPIDPSPGGIDGVVLDMARAWISAGNSVILLGATKDQGSKLGHPIAVSLPQGDLRFIPLARDGGKRSKWLPLSGRLALSILLLRRKLPHGGDLHIHRFEYGLVSWALRPNSTTVYLHGDLSKGVGRHSDSIWRALPPLALGLEKRIVKRADHTVVFSEDAFDRLASCSRAIQLMSAWYDSNVFFPKATTNSRLRSVLWVGRLEIPKDPLLALEVVSALRTRIPWPIRFTMIGQGALELEVSDRIDKLQLSANTTWIKTATPVEVAEAMRSHDVLLMTSRFEGAPRVLTEALACGTPVVATHESDSMALLYGTVGLRVQSRDPGALADAIAGLGLPSPATCASRVAGQSASQVLGTHTRDSGRDH